MPLQKTSLDWDDIGYLDGQLLLAMPALADSRFQRTVIYMCAHTAQGAMGLILNQHIPDFAFANLLKRLKIEPPPDTAPLPREMRERPIHIGGPVEMGCGFALHTSDYSVEHSTLKVDSGISLTITPDIVRAMIAGQGPRRCLLALGYSGWSPGQLEQEIQANSWLSCPADADLVFDADIETKYTRALAKLGVNPSFLVSDAGHA